MLTANDVARYFLAIQDEIEGPEISNMKLQKLCYYAQGFHLALFDEPLFDDSIEAWEHGPVVPDVYRRYKSFGSGSIPVPDDLEWDIYDQRTRDHLDEIAQVYGQFSAWKLREMTHLEPPWRDAKRRSQQVIATEDLKRYFKTQLD